MADQASEEVSRGQSADLTSDASPRREEPGQAPVGFLIQSQAHLEALVKQFVGEARSTSQEARPRGKCTRKRSPSPSSVFPSYEESGSVGKVTARPPRPKRAKQVPVQKQTDKRQRRKKPAASDPWLSETPGSSPSAREEGELSDDPEMDAQESSDRLFPVDIFPRLLSKVRQTLGITQSAGSAEAQEEQPTSRFLQPRRQAKPPVVPFPVPLKGVLEAEWKAPNRAQRMPRVFGKLYNLPDDVSDKLRVPSVDQPVAALSSSAVLPSEGEGGPKDQCDRRVESALKRDFEATALAFKAAAANSVVSRATLEWVDQILKKDDTLSSATANTLKKISLATAFTADSSLDAMQLSAKALAANAVARRNIWLRQWEVDQGSQSRLVSVPFAGSKLFGQALDPLLVEGRDKRMVLPTARKEPTKTKSFSRPSFRDQRTTFRQKDSNQRKGRWDKPKFYPRGKNQGGGESSGTAKPRKSQRPS